MSVAAEGNPRRVPLIYLQHNVHEWTDAGLIVTQELSNQSRDSHTRIYWEEFPDARGTVTGLTEHWGPVYPYQCLSASHYQPILYSISEYSADVERPPSCVDANAS